MTSLQLILSSEYSMLFEAVFVEKAGGILKPSLVFLESTTNIGPPLRFRVGSAIGNTV